MRSKEKGSQYKNNLQWILNLDIDYFFTDDRKGAGYQFLTDQYVLNLCREIERALDRIDAVTIALSPDFCGDGRQGWQNSLRIVSLISNHFDLRLNNEDLLSTPSVFDILNRKVANR